MTRSIQQLFDLKGKTALITGGSRGLGLQLAQALGDGFQIGGSAVAGFGAALIWVRSLMK
jgi:NAD(P)-dependent dehydrogenase (short-subunit alcohol dehydrogenase family)